MPKRSRIPEGKRYLRGVGCLGGQGWAWDTQEEQDALRMGCALGLHSTRLQAKSRDSELGIQQRLGWPENCIFTGFGKGFARLGVPRKQGVRTGVRIRDRADLSSGTKVQ